MKTRWLPGRAALIDMALLGAAWLAIRLPLLVFHLAPLVQVDSFWQRPLPDSLSSPHAPFLYGQFVFSFGAYWGAIIQHLLVLFAGVVLYEVARRAAGRAAGLCTGLFIVLHGGFVLYAHSFMSETLFNFFLALHLGALWMALTADSGKRAAVWFFVTGVLAGVATNVRPTAQCQVLVLPLAMLPFYVRHGERLKFVRLTAALLAGFALIYVPVATLVWRNADRFTLSTGMAKVIMYRLVDDQAAPIGRVRVDDPQLAAIRDYLATPTHGRIWFPAYDHIRTAILGLPADARYAATLPVDPYVMRLWWRFVATYPGHYLAGSLRGLFETLATHVSLTDLYATSRQQLDPVEMMRHPLYDLKMLPAPSASHLRLMDRLYYVTDFALTNPVVVGFVLLCGLYVLSRMQGAARRFLVCVYATAVGVYTPQFFLSIKMSRYRYPFDLVFALLFGIVAGRLVVVTGEWLRRRKAGNSRARSST